MPNKPTHKLALSAGVFTVIPPDSLRYDRLAGTPSSLFIPLRTSVEFLMNSTFIKWDHDFISIICSHCGNKIHVPVYCGDRFCPTCGLPRRLNIRKRMEWLIKQFKPAQGIRLKQMTFTIRNQPDLPIMLKHLVKSFRRLRQRAYWKNSVQGGCFVLEITGRPGNWHAHIHAIVESYYVDFFKLLALWKTVSGGSGVYIQARPPGKIIKHLTQYLTKPEIPELVESEINAALKGFRLFQPFGTWYKMNLKYEKPHSICTECGRSEWIPEFLFYATSIPSPTFRAEKAIHMEC